MVLREGFVIQVELLDHISACPGQNLRRHQVHTEHIVLAEFHLWVHHPSQIVLFRDLEENELSLDHGYLNVELSDLGDLGQ